MRLGKRNFRHKLRWGFQPYFNKRGDRVPNPNSIQIMIEEGQLPKEFLNPQKFMRLLKKFEAYSNRRRKDFRYSRVAEITMPDGAWISTVYLTANCQFKDPGVPINFETMIFDASIEELDHMCYRCSRLSDAKKQHRNTVIAYRKALKQANKLSGLSNQRNSEHRRCSSR